MAYLVLIETSGNQGYIFATNKLRENVGASELVRRVGTSFVLDAVKGAGGPAIDQTSGEATRRALLDESKNPPLERGTLGIEVVLATSGKALLLVADVARARALVRNVTARALAEAPGVNVAGAMVEVDWGRHVIHERVREVHREADACRSRLPSSEVRFLRLPVVAECASSGLPAERVDGNEAEPCSTVALCKRAAAGEALKRMASVSASRLPRSVDDLEDLLASRGQQTWLAVLHADGNGLGQTMLSFDELVGAKEPSTNRRYVSELRAFSCDLDGCTEEAFRAAVRGLETRGAAAKGGPLSVFPLVLGGDDLTLVADGRSALGLAEDFLRVFEQETRRVFDGRWSDFHGLTSCAGVAIVKPHFPFCEAYDLAEALLKSAKGAKRVRGRNQAPVASALDFHVLFDSSDADLERIRASLRIGDPGSQGRVELYSGPFVVTPMEELKERGAPQQGIEWAERHEWRILRERVEVIRRRGLDRRPVLPGHLLHELREGLFLGQGAADARLGLALARDPTNEACNDALRQVAERHGASLFFDDDGAAKARLLDVLYATDFLD